MTAAPSVNSIRLVNVDLRSAWSMMAGTITLALARPRARRQRTALRPHLRTSDRRPRIRLSRPWSGWTDAAPWSPSTLIRWQRSGFELRESPDSRASQVLKGRRT